MTGAVIPVAPGGTKLTASPRSGYRALIIAGVTAACLAALVGIAVPAGIRWDFGNFYDTGRRVAAGQIQDIYNPAGAIDGRPPHGQMAFWGTPISAALYVPFGLFQPEIALVLFKLVATATFAAGLWLLFEHTRRIAVRRGADPQWYAAAYIALVLLYQPFWTIYRVGGQTTPWIFLLLVLALGRYVRTQWLSAVLLLVLAVLIKPAFVFVPAFLVFVSGRKFLLALTSVAFSAGLLSLALYGWPIHAQFLDLMRHGSSRPSPWPYNSSLYIVADAFRSITNSIPIPGTGEPVPALIQIGLVAFVIATIFLLTLRLRRLEGEAGRHAAFLLAISFCLLIMRVVWEHYLSVLFIPLAFLLANWPRHSAAAKTHLLVIFALAVLQNLILVMFVWSHLSIQSTPALLAVSLVKAGPLLGYLGFLLWRRDAVLDAAIDSEPRLRAQMLTRTAPDDDAIPAFPPNSRSSSVM